MTIQEAKDLIIFAKENNINKLSFDGMSVEFDVLVRDAAHAASPAVALAAVPREELLAAFKAAQEEAAIDETWST